MAKVTMSLNVPVTVEHAKYLDWMPPTQFGSQLRLKGEINGDPQAVLYIPGKCWAVGRALVNAGVIAEMSFYNDPAEAMNIPLIISSFTLLNKQVDGKNYGNISVTTATARQKAPVQPTPQNAGPLLPGEETGYIDALAGGLSEQEVRPGVTVFEGRQPDVKTGDPMEAVGALYLECMKFVVDRIVPFWEAGQVAYDASTLNAATATLMIQRGKR